MVNIRPDFDPVRDDGREGYTTPKQTDDAEKERNRMAEIAKELSIQLTGEESDAERRTLLSEYNDMQPQKEEFEIYQNVQRDGNGLDINNDGTIDNNDTLDAGHYKSKLEELGKSIGKKIDEYRNKGFNTVVSFYQSLAESVEKTKNYFRDKYNELNNKGYINKEPGIEVISVEDEESGSVVRTGENEESRPKVGRYGKIKHMRDVAESTVNALGERLKKEGYNVDKYDDIYSQLTIEQLGDVLKVFAEHPNWSVYERRAYVENNYGPFND